jgi:plasmid maintenance system antidote protein VapI
MDSCVICLVVPVDLAEAERIARSLNIGQTAVFGLTTQECLDLLNSADASIMEHKEEEFETMLEHLYNQCAEEAASKEPEMARTNRNPVDLVRTAVKQNPNADVRVASLLLGNKRDVISRVVNGISSTTPERANKMVEALENANRPLHELMTVIRLQRSLRASDVAPYMGIDHRRYGRIESGTIEVTFKDFQKFYEGVQANCSDF